MLIEPFARFLLRHELRFRSYREHGVPLPLVGPKLDVVGVLKAAVQAGEANLILRSQDVVQLTCVDVRPKDHLAVLLFRRSDPDAATPVFEHRKTNKLRIADKSDDEAIAVSCHLFVHLGEIPAIITLT